MARNAVVGSAVRICRRRQRVAERVDCSTNGIGAAGVRRCIGGTVIPVVVVAENALLHTGSQHLPHNSAARMRNVVIPQCVEEGSVFYDWSADARGVLVLADPRYSRR